MRGVWEALRGKEPIERGLKYAIGVTVALVVLMDLLLFLTGLEPPSADLQQALAQIGATLLIAYVVETAWIVQVTKAQPKGDKEERLGVTMGFGAVALVGITASLLLAGHAEAGYRNWLDEIGFGFVIGPLLMIGTIVVLQPMLTYEWTHGD